MRRALVVMVIALGLALAGCAHGKAPVRFGHKPGQPYLLALWVPVPAPPLMTDIEIVYTRSSTCGGFHHADVVETARAVSFKVWVVNPSENCTRDLIEARATVHLKSPIGARPVLGGCTIPTDPEQSQGWTIAQKTCEDLAEVVAPSTARPTYTLSLDAPRSVKAGATFEIRLVTDAPPEMPESAIVALLSRDGKPVWWITDRGAFGLLFIGNDWTPRPYHGPWIFKAPPEAGTYELCMDVRVGESHVCTPLEVTAA